ncbi:MAG: hypothetical protein ABI581_08525 [Sediminibacterium sp.]
MEECALHTFALWPPGSDTPSLTITEKVWYCDSIGISEMCTIVTTQNDTISTIKAPTIGFRYFDLRDKSIYEYRHFSDTALPVRRFIGSDTSKLSGGWNFIKPPNPLVDTLTRLPDTVIANIVHQKYRMTFKANGYNFVSFGLFRCDIQSTIFDIDPVLNKRVGCPMVGLHILPVGSNGLGSNQQIKVNSNEFPDSVRKVFTAWRENEKRYPIQ